MSSAPASTLKLMDVLAGTQIPALPTSAMALLELAQDPANGPLEYARPIEADIGLLGQVLRFVNSSYFGFSREIASVPQAIQLVGVRTIKNFALWSAVFSLIPNPKFGAFELKALWQDSLRRAVFSRALGRAIKLANAEDLFAAALLQDMAIPILLKGLPDQYEHLIERRNREHLRLSSLERELFGWDHAEAAAALCRNWRLPEEFALLIERHTALDELLGATPPKRDAACIAIAAMLPSCRDQAWDEKDQFVAGVMRIGGAAVMTSAFIHEVDSCFADFAPLLQLPVPEKSLYDWLIENK
ncbi:MAG: HDOD domain-containing protein [Pirellulales bacterium]